MGTANEGVFGPGRGRIGNLVYYMRKGKQVVRTIGVNHNPPSEAQLESRMRMSVANAFCKVVRPFTDYGFLAQTEGRDLSPYNVAMSYNRTNAIKGTYPNLSLNYEKALLSEGPLLQADNAKVIIVEDGIEFSWYVDPQLHWPDTTDQAMLMVIFPELGKVAYTLFGAPRTAGKALLEISTPMLSEYMETYIAFISANRKQVSTSVYAGSLNQ